MTTAVIYARFSSDKQREESIEGQVRVCTKFAKDNDLEVLRIYTDRALSARTDQRPGFLEMVADSEKGLFKYVIVYQLDRFSRNRYDSAVYKHRLGQHGVKVLSAMENITDDPSGILLESLIEGVAEYYSAELSQKVKRGMTENILERKWAGSHVPLGYALDAAHHLVTVEPAAQTVRDLYRLCLSGTTYVHMAERLNRAGYRTALGHVYTGQTVKNLLGREIYTGTYTWAGETVEGFCEALVSKEDYAKVMARITAKRKAKEPKAVQRDPETYKLTGRITCGQCGRYMTGFSGTGRKGVTYYYYRCSWYNNKTRREDRGTPCTSKMVSRDELEALVLQTTVTILRSPDMLRAIAEQAAAVQIESPYEEEIQIKRAKLQDLTKRHDNSVRAIEAGVLSETIASNIQKYEKEIGELRVRLEQLQLLSKPAAIDALDVEYYLRSLLLNKKEHDAFRLDVLDTFVRRVVVYPDKVEIWYNYAPDSHLPEQPVSVPLSAADLNTAKLVGLLGFEPRTNRL